VNNSGLKSISISQIKEILNITSSELENDFIISDNEISSVNFEFFRYPTRIDGYLFAICTSGEIKISINLSELKLTAGKIAINFPENIVQVNEIGEDAKGYFLLLSNDFLREIKFELEIAMPLYMLIKKNPCIALTNNEMNSLIEFHHLIKKMMEFPNEKYRMQVIRGLMTALAYNLSAIIGNHSDEIVQIASGTKTRKEIFFEKFMILLKEYHRDEREVNFYAEKLCITPKYLSSMIKDISGRSAAEWIGEFVILEAKSLLKYSDMTIQEIAYSLHFPTQSFFGKYFKHHTGMSPSKYKMQ